MPLWLIEFYLCGVLLSVVSQADASFPAELYLLVKNSNLWVNNDQLQRPPSRGLGRNGTENPVKHSWDKQMKTYACVVCHGGGD